MTTTKTIPPGNKHDDIHTRAPLQMVLHVCSEVGMKTRYQANIIILQILSRRRQDLLDVTRDGCPRPNENAVGSIKLDTGTDNESIEQVQQEIENLEAKRQTLKSCTPAHTNVWTVATEYFQQFRYGYRVLASMTSLRPNQSQTQLDFLKKTMADDVTDGTVTGVNALLENWRLISLYHNDTYVRLKSLQHVAEGSVIASATMSLTITENTLRHVYSHLVEDDEEKEVWYPLALRLLNQRLGINGSVRFDWDKAICRIVRLESKFDFVSAMLKLLGNLEDVARVLKKHFDENNLPEDFNE